MAKSYVLSEEDVTTLRSIADDYRSGTLARMPAGPPMPERLGAGPPRQTMPRPTVFGLLESAVEATSARAAPPKTGTLNVYSVTSTGGTTDTGRDLTVYNINQLSYTTHDWVLASQERHGKWLLDLGGAQICFGKPQSEHASGTLATYDLFWPNSTGDAFIARGRTLTGVYQETGETFSTDTNHVIWATQTAGWFQHVSFPYEVTNCEGVDLNFGTPAKITATSSDNTVVKTGSYHRIDTPSTTWTTIDVDTINGGTVGDVLVLMAHAASRTVVLKDSGGNLNLDANTDFSLDDTKDRIMLIAVSTGWNEISRSNNG